MELQYKPSDEFEVKNLNPLDDNDVTETEELWLIQCPISHVCVEDEFLFTFSFD